MTRRIRLLFVAVMLACSGMAAASPAQDLFDQAAYLLIVNYGGFSSASPKALEAQFQLELDKACAGQVETCPYTRAHPVITRTRHRSALEECNAALDRALYASAAELRAEDVRLAARAVGRITGRIGVEDLLDVIFREFCIGK